MSGTAAPPRFAADVMLGRLARWLRVLGCDVAYGAHLHGMTLVRRARDEERVLLTRDSRLLRRVDPPPHVFVRSNLFREQVAQVVAAVPLGLVAPFSRCLDCNQPLEDVVPEHVAGRVPTDVAATQRRFQHCPRCHKVFWPGAHRARMEREVAAMGVADG